jgi:catechol 2,3-dioxygenase
MQSQTTAASAPSIHPDTRLGPVTLRIANLDRALQFYEGVLGFQRLAPLADLTLLGAAGAPPLVRLQLTPGARPMPRSASGLYHFAILVPTRADLGRSLRRLAEAGVDIGQSDHLVSEALYVSDPDGNGIEIYRDRPRSAWTWSNGFVQMAVGPLDLVDLLAEGDRDPRPWTGLPAGTRIGHVHLQVSDTERAAGFYHGLLGFDITARLPGAVFAGAGGYHHHLGLNSWSSRGALPAPPATAGLESFEIEVPSASEQARLAERLTAAAVPLILSDGRLSLHDPWNIEVVVVHE